MYLRVQNEGILDMSSKSGKGKNKSRDPSWRLRHALGHKVEDDPKHYIRKQKHRKQTDEKY